MYLLYCTIHGHDQPLQDGSASTRSVRAALMRVHDHRTTACTRSTVKRRSLLGVLSYRMGRLSLSGPFNLNTPSNDRQAAVAHSKCPRKGAAHQHRINRAVLASNIAHINITLFLCTAVLYSPD